jgi:VWFA-related protein
VTFGAAVAPLAELTGNVAPLRAAVGARQPAGQTSLIDASFSGLMLAASEPRRSLLLVFSDGSDTASWLTADAVVDAARRGDTVAYAVVTHPLPRRAFLRDLTSTTGGDVVELKATTDLDATFLRLLDEYRRRYLLSYTPRGVPKGGWHQLDVRVRIPGATVKARPGYWGT